MTKKSFTYNKRVRYKDIDAMGIVYYSRYFEFFESARDEMMRDMGLSNKELEQLGYYLPVIESHCEYKQGAEYNEDLAIKCNIPAAPRVKLRINYVVKGKNDRMIANGYTEHAFIDEQGQPTRPPEVFLELFED